MPKKTIQLNLRVDEVDLARLERLAAHHEVSQAQVIRTLIKQAAEALPPLPTKNAKRGTR